MATRGDKPAGRGARSNRTGRFERETVTPTEDGWWPAAEEAMVAKTTVTPESPRTIIASNDSPDVPFDLSINPYKGCEHGCVYCFARPTHAYLGLSPGLDFETRIFSKPSAPELLRRELARRSYRPQTIALGANTDPYQPAERKLEITRRLLEVFREHRHPVAIVTKSALVLRDLDILAPMASAGLAHVHVSITTLDRQLARRMEPRASTPAERLQTVGTLAENAVPTGVLASPMIPALNDAEAEGILAAAAEAGAISAGYILLRLPLELEELFFEWLEANYPLKAARVMSLLRDTRRGALYRSAYGERMRGAGPYADLLARRFDAARSRLGLAHRPPRLDTTRFRVPPRHGGTRQLDLFASEAARRRHR